MTIYMWIAAAAWGLLAAGVLMRRRRVVHVGCMNLGILCDLGLVLYLQITRDAVQKALSFSLSPLQQVHIAFSTAALLLYIPTLILGWQLVRGRRELRPLHLRLGLTAFGLRTLGFLFMFSMWR